jgi:hypothetical protein
MRIWLGTTGLYAPPPLSMLVEARANSNAPMKPRILSSLWDEATTRPPSGNVEWTDLGDPYRGFVTLLERNGSLPGWAKL